MQKVNTENCNKNWIDSVKSWLDTLGFKYLLDSNHENPLKDPLRNGVLICKVLIK